MSENTGELIQAAARQLRRRYASAIAQWDIAPAQARALRLVCALESPRLSVIAERLRIAPRSATEVVDLLEGRGLVRRVPDPGDRRATCVEPTAAGIELGALIEEARKDEGNAFLAGLAPADRAELGRILTELLGPQD